MLLHVGIRNALRLMGAYEAAITAAESTDVTAAAVMPQIASPWTPEPDGLSPIVWADLLGSAWDGPLTRAAAVALPAVARNRHLVAGTIARLPLVAYPGTAVTDEEPAPLADQPDWLTRTDQPIPAYHRMLWTVDDLIFSGWSLWQALRGPGGELEAVDRVAVERWDTDEAGRLRIDGELVQDPASVVLIPGPHEGILHFGAKALRMAINNAENAARAAATPSAHLDLHYTGDAELSDEAIDSLIARWAAARRGENGGVGFTNKLIEAREMGSYSDHLLVEGRNADAVDVARLISNPAAMGDATNAGASLTYETTDGRNGQFIDYGLALYMAAIEARLSQDDVTPTGTRVGFYTASIRNLDAPATTTGPNRED